MIRINLFNLYQDSSKNLCGANTTANSQNRHFANSGKNLIQIKTLSLAFIMYFGYIKFSSKIEICEKTGRFGNVFYPMVSTIACFEVENDEDL